MLGITRKILPFRSPPARAGNDGLRDYVTIVSGLPRSGTSMMMRMLEKGGMPVMTDGVREADEDNPRGYYEFEAVKTTREDPSWVDDARGKAVKMVYRLLVDLPREYSFRVLFMERSIVEILASQRQMLVRCGRNPNDVAEEDMAALFQQELTRCKEWVAQQANFDILSVSYNEIMAGAVAPLSAINDFLDGTLDTTAMSAVIDHDLYRNRDTGQA